MKKYYVAGFLFTEDRNNVVLIRKNKPEWQKQKLNAVGGKMELYDSCPKTAMIREFKEEAGVEVLDWKQFLKIEGDFGVVYFFKAFNNDAFDKADTMEAEQIEKHSIADLNTRISHHLISNLSWIVPMALDADDVVGEIQYPVTGKY